jgi:hypothetical protein
MEKVRRGADEPTAVAETADPEAAADRLDRADTGVAVDESAVPAGDEAPADVGTLDTRPAPTTTAPRTPKNFFTVLPSCAPGVRGDWLEHDCSGADRVQSGTGQDVQNTQVIPGCPEFRAVFCSSADTA